MHRLGFKYMTKNPAILAPEKGTANTAAVAVLGGFALLQLGLALHSLWPILAPIEKLQKAFSPSSATHLASPAEAKSVPVVSSPAQPSNALTLPALPGGMVMPTGGKPRWSLVAVLVVVLAVLEQQLHKALQQQLTKFLLVLVVLEILQVLEPMAVILYLIQ